MSRKHPDHTHRPGGFRRVLKTAGYMLLMGIAAAWLTILANPLERRLGVAPSTASRLPNFAFFIGVAIGLGMGLVASVKRFVGFLFGIALFGGVLWFFALLIGALLLAMGVPETVVDWLPPAGFAIGILLGGFALAVTGYEKVKELVRFTKET